MEIHPIPAFADNYIWLIREPREGAVGVVDPGDATPVIDALTRAGWTLTHIFNTHHHADHIGGNRELKRLYNADVIGARADAARIPDMETCLGGGDAVRFGAETARVVDTPGHTVGHIAFYFPESKALFCGDTLFSLGCGRLFEGTAAQMWSSLSNLRALPDETLVCCGHEYTLSNARFALTVDPENADLQERAREVERRRAAGLPTLPSSIGLERRTNPFLRADDPALQANLGMEGATAEQVFAELRRRKDAF